jgi:hypothetical protein
MDLGELEEKLHELSLQPPSNTKSLTTMLFDRTTPLQLEDLNDYSESPAAMLVDGAQGDGGLMFREKVVRIQETLRNIARCADACDALLQTVLSGGGGSDGGGDITVTKNETTTPKQKKTTQKDDARSESARQMLDSMKSELGGDGGSDDDDQETKDDEFATNTKEQKNISFKKRKQPSANNRDEDDDEEEEMGVSDALKIELACFSVVCDLLWAYRLEQASTLISTKIFYVENKATPSTTTTVKGTGDEKSIRSLLLFDEVFIVESKCRAVVAAWRAAHRGHGEKKRAADFPFIRHWKLCASAKELGEYSAWDLVCAVRLLASQWTLLPPSLECEEYLAALRERAAVLMTRYFSAGVHDDPRYRRPVVTVGGGGETKLYTANQSFIWHFSIAFHALEKRLRASQSVGETFWPLMMDALFEPSSSKERRRVFDYTGDTSGVGALVHEFGGVEVDYDAPLEQQHHSVGSPPPSPARKEASSIASTLDRARLVVWCAEEIFKFEHDQEISLRMLQWMHRRAEKLAAHGEETMRSYKKMTLAHSFPVGEDAQYTVRAPPGKNRGVEYVLRMRVGVRAFNNIVDSLNHDPNKILPTLTKTFEKVRPLSARVVEKYARACAKNSSSSFGSSSLKREGKDTNGDGDDEINVGFPHLPGWLARPDGVYRATRFDIIHELLELVLVDAYFRNTFSISWQEKFMYFERDLDAQYEALSHAHYPVFVQSFNSFSIFYGGCLIETNHFLLSFYLWMRILDVFHSTSACGRSLRPAYDHVFGAAAWYDEHCRPSLTKLFADKQNKKKKSSSMMTMADAGGATEGIEMML